MSNQLVQFKSNQNFEFRFIGLLVISHHFIILTSQLANMVNQAHHVLFQDNCQLTIQTQLSLLRRDTQVNVLILISTLFQSIQLNIAICTGFQEEIIL